MSSREIRFPATTLFLITGSGTIIYPIAKGVSKQLLPIYDRPMVYEPISGRMREGTPRG